MAGSIKVNSATGQGLYVTVHNAADQLANGASTEVFNSSNWSTYKVAIAEQGITGYYTGVFPSYLPAGLYFITIYQGTGTYGDTSIGNLTMYWNGSTEEQGIGSVLQAYLLDKLLLNAAGGTLPTIGSFLDQIMNKDGSQSFSQAADSLQAIVASGSSGPSAATIAAAVWDLVVTGGAHIVPGSAAQLIQAIAAMLPSSGPLSNFNPAATPVNLNGAQGSVTIGTVNALGSTALTAIAGQILALLNATAMPELTGVPPATATIFQAIMFLYMAIRNAHTATATQEKLANNAGSVIATAPLSDDGTTSTKGQFS